MGRIAKSSVCRECADQCRLLHGGDKESTPYLPTSFFKIMLGDFSKYLYIPPRFVRTVKPLCGKKVILMDSCKKQWEVTLTLLHGSYAFEKGWDDFSSDHDLNLGEILIFNYIKESYFEVLIYDISGCKKVDFLRKRNLKKRSRDGRTKSVSIAEHCEDPCLTNRELGDNKTSMFDVLDCEILNNCDDNVTRKITNGDTNVDPVTPNMYKDESSSPGETSKRLKNKLEDMTPLLATESERAVISHPNPIFNGIPNLLDTMDISVPSPCEIEKTPRNMTPNVCSFEDKFHATDQMSKLIKKETVDPVPPDLYKDEFPSAVKSELQEMTPNPYKCELLAAGLSSKAIKREPGQSVQPFNEDRESHYQTAATVSCVVPTDDSFLELPAPLPLSNKRGMKMDRLVVYLRNQMMELWPVLYHERSNFCILTEGWSEYRKANNIHPADLCIFAAENNSNRIISVNVVRQ